MSEDGEGGLGRFFEWILSRNLSEAKAELGTNPALKNGGFGRHMAARGIVALLEDRPGVGGLLKDEERLDRLESMFRERRGSIWCDGFERDYFDTWIRFIVYCKRRGSDLTGGKKGVDEDPGEEEERNE